MTRLMGDATHANVPALATVPGLQLVAGYDSGSADIDWTPQDWAQFPGLPQVHIDQAFGTPVNVQAHVVVFDIETGAYQPSQAGQLIAVNVTARPTIYVNQSNIVATVQSALTAPNWRGDTWVALPGWNPGDPWPASVQQAISLGAVLVAVQNQLDVASAYDLSAVLDPAWPAVAAPGKENNMPVIIYADAGVYLLDGGKMHHIADVGDLNIYRGAQLVQIGNPGTGNGVSAAELTALLADYPPGNPAVTVNTPPPPPVSISMTGTATPA